MPGLVVMEHVAEPAAVECLSARWADHDMVGLIVEVRSNDRQGVQALPVVVIIVRTFHICSMRFSRDQLVFMALMALDEIADASASSPAPKSVTLRFVLAWLFEESGANPEVEWVFRNFWKITTAPLDPNEQMNDYIRGSGARSAINGICRALGRENDVAFDQERQDALRRLRGGKS